MKPVYVGEKNERKIIRGRKQHAPANPIQVLYVLSKDETFPSWYSSGPHN
jgi:hypothetical protein